MKEQTLLTYVAWMQIGLELTDRMLSSKYAVQKKKNLMNQIVKELEKDVIGLYKNLPQGNDTYYNDAVKHIGETLLNAIESKGIDNVVMILKALNDGQIGVMDENKHSKILKQIDTI
jgi:hypothetical protein